VTPPHDGAAATRERTPLRDRWRAAPGGGANYKLALSSMHADSDRRYKLGILLADSSTNLSDCHASAIANLTCGGKFVLDSTAPRTRSRLSGNGKVIATESTLKRPRQATCIQVNPKKTTQPLVNALRHWPIRSLRWPLPRSPGRAKLFGPQYFPATVCDLQPGWSSLHHFLRQCQGNPLSPGNLLAARRRLLFVRELRR